MARTTLTLTLDVTDLDATEQARLVTELTTAAEHGEGIHVATAAPPRFTVDVVAVGALLTRRAGTTVYASPPTATAH